MTTVVVYVVICRTTRGHLPDYYGLQRGHLPDYACYSTGLPWSLTWSSTGPRCKKDRTIVVIYVVICRTTRSHLANFRCPLRDYLPDYASRVVIHARPGLPVPWSSTWSSTGLPWSSTFPLPDLRGHVRSHLPDYAWSPTGLPWSSALLSGNSVVISWTVSASLIWNCHP